MWVRVPSGSCRSCFVALPWGERPRDSFTRGSPRAPSLPRHRVPPGAGPYSMLPAGIVPVGPATLPGSPETRCRGTPGLGPVHGAVGRYFAQPRWESFSISAARASRGCWNAENTPNTTTVFLMEILSRERVWGNSADTAVHERGLNCSTS